MTKTTFGIMGGDLRSAYAALYFAKQGYRVCAAGLENAPILPAALKCSAKEALAADAVVLPLPLLDGKGMLFAPFAEAPVDAFSLVDMSRAGGVLLGGRVPRALAAHAEKHGRILLDYFAEESLQLRNAVPTAEGTLAILMEELPVTVHGAQVAVTGFGRTAQTVARLLQAVGARVTVVARKTAARALAQTMGLETLSFEMLERGTHRFDALVNTVPAPVLTGEMLAGLGKDCVLVDIASAPWGFDAGAAESLGFRARRAPALPGRTAPATAGTIVAQTVLEMLEERGKAV